MSNVERQIAAAMKTRIEGESLSISPTAVRRAYVATTQDLDSVGTLTITIAPQRVQTVYASRKQVDEIHTIDVAVQGKVAGLTTTLLDPLADVATEIRDLFFDPQNAKLPGYTPASCIGCEMLIARPDHLIEHTLFSSILTFNFRVIRTPA